MTTEPLIAYISGETPPDFEAIAAFGCDLVCLDTLAPWFNASSLAEARANGLTAVSFRMGYVAPSDTNSRTTRRSRGRA
ncbi:MAG TPA: hypothetical protein VJN70_03560 [Gemmatimonadaceae bacterium]|nr:hypothetical protein [Gemmatimonadaceae bacterium]